MYRKDKMIAKHGRAQSATVTPRLIRESMRMIHGAIGNTAENGDAHKFCETKIDNLLNRRSAHNAWRRMEQSTIQPQ
jgi:hypothetical protein